MKVNFAICCLALVKVLVSFFIAQECETLSGVAFELRKKGCPLLISLLDLRL